MFKSEFAKTLLSSIKNVLRYLGVKDDILSELDELIFIVIIVIVALILGLVIRLLAINFIHRFLKFRKLSFLQSLIKNKAISKISNLVPPLLISGFLPFALDNSSHLFIICEKITWIYFLVMLIISAKGVGNAAVEALKKKEEWQNKPIKGFIELIDIIFVFVVIIIIISLLFDKSPMTLITGLSAFAAVLLLIFKGIIIGFVSGVLVSENDMVHIGDWIQIPGTAVNGIVKDISLATVKIENFDNTIITVPPDTLITSPLVNWRAMKESGGRRIMFSYNISLDSIKRCSPEFLIKMKSFDKKLSDFIDKELENKKNGIEQTIDIPTNLSYGTIDTNLGLFRQHMLFYIEDNNKLNKEYMYMIRTLDPTPQGIPLQVYCFSKITNWVGFEAIQSEVMEYVISILPQFELCAFQDISSKDIITHAHIESGKINIDKLPNII